MTKQFWADASTMNCVWLFQTSEEEPVVDKVFWRTERVFLTREEARIWGKARPYVWGEENEGWRIYGVPCDGVMANILGKFHKNEYYIKRDVKQSINDFLKDVVGTFEKNYWNWGGAMGNKAIGKTKALMILDNLAIKHFGSQLLEETK